MSSPQPSPPNISAAAKAQVPAAQSNSNLSQLEKVRLLPKAMDTEWTDRQDRKQEFYRLSHPKQITSYDEKNGFTAPDTELILKSFEENRRFFEIIRKHRKQMAGDFRSPFVSLLENREEAEEWTKAAAGVFGDKVVLSTINGGHESLAGTPMWRVADIERGIASRLGGDFKGFEGSACQSEWLVLHRIPAAAIVENRSAAHVKYQRELRIAEVDKYFEVKKCKEDIKRLNEILATPMPNYACGCAYGKICEHLLQDVKDLKDSNQWYKNKNMTKTMEEKLEQLVKDAGGNHVLVDEEQMGSEIFGNGAV